MSDGDLSLDPIWRQAARDAIAEFRYGDTISHEWLYQHLHIRDCVDDKLTAAEHRKFAFDLLRKVDGFRDEMLVQHHRYLVNVRGEGYRIIDPPHQTTAAMTKLHRELRRSIAQAMGALVHINDTALSLDDARENAEAKAKVGAFASLHVKQLTAKKNGNDQEAA